MLGILSGPLTPDAHKTQGLYNWCIHAHLTERHCAWINRFNLMAQELLPRKRILRICYLMTLLIKISLSFLRISVKVKLLYISLQFCLSTVPRDRHALFEGSDVPLLLPEQRGSYMAAPLFSYELSHKILRRKKGLETSSVFLERGLVSFKKKKKTLLIPQTYIFLTHLKIPSVGNCI